MFQSLIVGAAEGVLHGFMRTFGFYIAVILIFMYIIYRIAESFPTLPVAKSYREFFEVLTSVDGWIGEVKEEPELTEETKEIE